MRAMGVDDVVRVVAAVLKRHRIPRANFAGHSFGTLVVAHMRKIFPEAVASVLLCDPVCPSFSAFLSKEKNRSFFPLKIFPEAVASVLLCDPVRPSFSAFLSKENKSIFLPSQDLPGSGGVRPPLRPGAPYLLRLSFERNFDISSLSRSSRKRWRPSSSATRCALPSSFDLPSHLSCFRSLFPPLLLAYFQSFFPSLRSCAICLVIPPLRSCGLLRLHILLLRACEPRTFALCDPFPTTVALLMFGNRQVSATTQSSQHADHFWTWTWSNQIPPLFPTVSHNPSTHQKQHPGQAPHCRCACSDQMKCELVFCDHIPWL